MDEKRAVPPEFMLQFLTVRAVDDGGRALFHEIETIPKEDSEKEKSILIDPRLNLTEQEEKLKEHQNKLEEIVKHHYKTGFPQPLFHRVGTTVDNNLTTCLVCKDFQADALDGEFYDDEDNGPKVDPAKVSDVQQKITKECEVVQHLYGLEFKERRIVKPTAIGDGPYMFYLVMEDHKKTEVQQLLTEHSSSIGVVTESFGESSMFIYDHDHQCSKMRPEDKLKLIFAAMVGRLIRPIEFIKRSVDNKAVLKAHALCEEFPPRDHVFLQQVENVSRHVQSIINTGEYQHPYAFTNILLCMPPYKNRFIYHYLVILGANVCYYNGKDFIPNNTVHLAIYINQKHIPSVPVLHTMSVTSFKQFIINNFYKYYVTNRLYPAGVNERIILRTRKMLKFETDKQKLIDESGQRDPAEAPQPAASQPSTSTAKRGTSTARSFSKSKSVVKDEDKENRQPASRNSSAIRSSKRQKRDPAGGDSAS